MSDEVKKFFEENEKKLVCWNRAEQYGGPVLVELVGMVNETYFICRMDDYSNPFSYDRLKMGYGFTNVFFSSKEPRTDDRKYVVIMPEFVSAKPNSMITSSDKKLCSCSMQQLMMTGCVCGGI